MKKLKELLSEKLTSKQKTAIMIILFITGLMLLLLPTSKEENNRSLELVNSYDYKTSLEKQLSDMLSEVKGVGKVKVMITLKGENSRTIAYNENKSVSTTESSTREDVSKDAILIREDAKSVPYTLNEEYPEVAGVLVVTSGAEDSLIKSYIISAVRSTLGVSANNITILPMSSEK